MIDCLLKLPQLPGEVKRFDERGGGYFCQLLCSIGMLHSIFHNIVVICCNLKHFLHENIYSSSFECIFSTLVNYFDPHVYSATFRVTNTWWKLFIANIQFFLTYFRPIILPYISLWSFPKVLSSLWLLNMLIKMQYNYFTSISVSVRVLCQLSVRKKVWFCQCCNNWTITMV